MDVSAIRARARLHIESLAVRLGIAKSDLDSVRVVDRPISSMRAGQWQPAHRTIEMNPSILKKDADYYETLVHEWAHALCTFLYPGRRIGHAREWQDVMRMLGASPDRCHSLEVESLPGFQAIHCKCGKVHQFSTRRVNNCKVRGMHYLCSSCRRILEVK